MQDECILLMDVKKYYKVQIILHNIFKGTMFEFQLLRRLTICRITQKKMQFYIF